MRFALAVGWLGIAAWAAAQQPPAPMILRDSTELFRGLLSFHKVKAVPSEQISQLDLAKTLLVVIESDAEWAGQVDLSLLSRRILRAGGAVLLADQRRRELGQFFPTSPRLRITPRAELQRGDIQLVTPGRPGEVELLMASQLGQRMDPVWLVFPTARLASWNAGTIRLEGPCPHLRNELARVVHLGLPRLVAVGATGPTDNPYRAAVLADPNLIRNRLMVEAGPTGDPLYDNLAVANRLAVWLRGTGDTAVTHCVFVERGQLITDFDAVQFDTPPPPPLPPINPEQLPSPTDRNFQKKLAEMVDNKLADLQESGAITRGLFGNLRDGERFARVMRGLAVVVAVGLLLITLRKLLQQRHEPSLNSMPKDTGQVGGRAPIGSLDRRCEELLQAGQYQSIVRDYLQALFEQAGFPRPDDNRVLDRHSYRLSGTDQKTLQGTVRILWEIAYGATPKPIPFSRWKELAPMIEAVRNAVMRGDLRISPQGANS